MSRTIRLLLILTLAVVLAGCAQPLPGSTPLPSATLTPLPTATATPAGTATPAAVPPAPTDEAAIRAGIQQSLDLLAQVYNDNLPDLLPQIVDQDNLPFRRLIKTQFDIFQQTYYAGQVTYSYLVDSIRTLQDGIVLAKIEAFGWLSADWLFRWTGSNWVLTEATVEQLGVKQTKETDQFIFEYYPWADDVNAEVIQLVENAAVRVKNKLGKLPAEKAVVRIKPNYGIDPYADPNALAYFQRGNSKEKDLIVIFAPNSYTFGYYDPSVGWQTELEDTITHEYTHMTHLRAFNHAGHLMDWFGEGLAEYVSDSDRVREVGLAIRQDALIPIIDTQTAVYKQDLMHLYILEKDVSLAYAESQALIIFLYDRGGMAMVWKLAETYDTVQDFDKALHQVVGLSYTDFDRAWRKWMSERY